MVGHRCLSVAGFVPDSKEVIAWEVGSRKVRRFGGRSQALESKVRFADHSGSIASWLESGVGGLLRHHTDKLP